MSLQNSSINSFSNRVANGATSYVYIEVFVTAVTNSPKIAGILIPPNSWLKKCLLPVLIEWFK